MCGQSVRLPACPVDRTLRLPACVSVAAQACPMLFILLIFLILLLPTPRCIVLSTVLSAPGVFRAYICWLLCLSPVHLLLHADHAFLLHLHCQLEQARTRPSDTRLMLCSAAKKSGWLILHRTEMIQLSRPDPFAIERGEICSGGRT